MNGMMGHDPQIRSGGRFRGRTCHRTTASLVFGTLAIGIGSLLLLDRFGIVDSSMIFRFWPAVLLLLGLGTLFRGNSMPPGIVLTVLGAVFLVRNLGYADVSFRDVWPLLLIVIGVAVLTNAIRSRRDPATVKAAREQDFLNDWALFGGVNKVVQSQNFQGGDLFAMFGGIEVNLRKARLNPDSPAVVNANAIFGGVELHVPDDWHVVNEGVGILGGYADSRRFVEAEGDAPVDQKRMLIVRGVAAFGGVDIKN